MLVLAYLGLDNLQKHLNTKILCRFLGEYRIWTWLEVGDGNEELGRGAIKSSDIRVSCVKLTQFCGISGGSVLSIS